MKFSGVQPPPPPPPGPKKTPNGLSISRPSKSSLWEDPTEWRVLAPQPMWQPHNMSRCPACSQEALVKASQGQGRGAVEATWCIFSSCL